MKEWCGCCSKLGVTISSCPPHYPRLRNVDSKFTPNLLIIRASLFAITCKQIENTLRRQLWCCAQELCGSLQFCADGLPNFPTSVNRPPTPRFLQASKWATNREGNLSKKLRGDVFPSWNSLIVCMYTRINLIQCTVSQVEQIDTWVRYCIWFDVTWNLAPVLSSPHNKSV